jgi:hypothetical protein
VGLFGIGLIAGHGFSIPRRGATFSEGIERGLTPANPPLHTHVMEASAKVSTGEEMITGMMSAMAQDDMLLRAYRLREILQNLNSAELAELFQRVVLLDDPGTRRTVLAPLLARWAAVDADSARAAVKPFVERLRKPHRFSWKSVESAVGEAWARALPESALAEAMNDPMAPWARNAAGWALAGLAQGDAAQQLEVLVKQPASRLRDDLSSALILSLAVEDFAAAEARLNLVSDDRQRLRIQADLLGKLAERDPGEALNRVVKMAAALPPGAAARHLQSIVFRAAARQDPAAAIAAVDQMPEEQRTQARAAVFAGWAGEDPGEALNWAAANGVNLREDITDSTGSTSSLISVALARDRERTIEWVRSQPPSVERDRLLVDGLAEIPLNECLQIYTEINPAMARDAAWSVISAFGSDLEGAERWVKDLPPGEGRTGAIRNLTSRQSANDPERLDSFLEGWTAGPDRDMALRGISTYLCRNQKNPERALDFANRTTDPTLRWKSYANIASDWLIQDEVSARNWMASTTELSAEDKRALIRQFEER